MGIVEEEADEILYWIEMLIDGGLVKQNRVKSLLDETNEIVSIGRFINTSGARKR